MLKVQRKQCDSCIYRRDSALDVKELERQIADPNMAGHFRGFRVCHHAGDRSKVCCRGFWNRHRDHFDAGQIAQRLELVEFVDVDRFAQEKTNDATRTGKIRRALHARPRAGEGAGRTGDRPRRRTR